MPIPQDVTNLSTDLPSAPQEQALPQAGAESADEQCLNGMHYIYDSNSDSFKNVGTCDTAHGVDQPSAEANTAYSGQFDPASKGVPADPNDASLLSPEAALRQKVQGINRKVRGGIDMSTKKSLGGMEQ